MNSVLAEETMFLFFSFLSALTGPLDSENSMTQIKTHGSGAKQLGFQFQHCHLGAVYRVSTQMHDFS